MASFLLNCNTFRKLSNVSACLHTDDPQTLLSLCSFFLLDHAFNT